MSDPTSWLLVKRGWKVLASDGRQLGSVRAVKGDPGRDIFDGLEVSVSEHRGEQYVPAEFVQSIEVGTVVLTIKPVEFATLEPQIKPHARRRFRW